MAHLEDLIKMGRVNNSTNDFWSLLDEEKQTAYIRTTMAAIADKAVFHKGNWCMAVNTPWSDEPKYIAIENPCGYKVYYNDTTLKCFHFDISSQKCISRMTDWVYAYSESEALEKMKSRHKDHIITRNLSF
jgi:hypothetical protein